MTSGTRREVLLAEFTVIGPKVVRMIEEVRGTVIGTIEFPFIFFTVGDDPKPITRIEWFADDAQAVKWFSETYPENYKAGAEMRRYYV